MLKRIHILLALSVISGLVISGCSFEDPQIELKNSRSKKAYFELQDLDGNYFYKGDVAPYSSTDYMPAKEGGYSVYAETLVETDTGATTKTLTMKFGALKDTKYSVVLEEEEYPRFRLHTEDIK